MGETWFSMESSAHGLNSLYIITYLLAPVYSSPMSNFFHGLTAHIEQSKDENKLVSPISIKMCILHISTIATYIYKPVKNL